MIIEGNSLSLFCLGFRIPRSTFCILIL